MVRSGSAGGTARREYTAASDGGLDRCLKATTRSDGVGSGLEDEHSWHMLRDALLFGLRAIASEQLIVQSTLLFSKPDVA